MPYTPAQQKAIAAKMSRQGKSKAEISRFFHEHGHSGSKPKPRKRRGR